MNIKPMYNLPTEDGGARIGISMDFDDADAVLEALRGLATVARDRKGAAVQGRIDTVYKLFTAIEQAKKI